MGNMLQVMCEDTLAPRARAHAQTHAHRRMMTQTYTHRRTRLLTQKGTHAFDRSSLPPQFTSCSSTNLSDN